MSTAHSSPPAFQIMTKPIGPICNLDCKYCFYLEKEKLYPDKSKWRMDLELLGTYIRQYIQSQQAPEVFFAWQGGEPTLMGVDFFRHAVQFQRKYADGRRISNSVQTNGTLLDDEWCQFFTENDFLIGLSIDGPRKYHDKYRIDKKGRPTFDDVMRGMALLKKHATRFNTLCVVNRHNSQAPLEVYEFLKTEGSGFMQFIPLVERIGPAGGPLDLAEPPEPKVVDGRVSLPLIGHSGLSTQDSGVASRHEGPAQSQIENQKSKIGNAPVAPWSVEPLAYGQFLCDIFDHWVRRDVGRVFVQIFDVQLGIWMGLPASLCVFAETCGNALAMEHNGDLYACDHYVYPKYKLGNIAETPMRQLVDSQQQRLFGTDKRDTLPKFCRQCDVRFACNGECPKHRFLTAPDGEYGLNYLCAGYKKFFHHIDPYMTVMARLLNEGRAAAEIMGMLAREEADRRRQAAWARVGRNDPCPCGSGRKYKKCCGARPGGLRPPAGLIR